MKKLDFKKQIEFLMRNKKMSASKLARRADLNHMTVCNYPNDKSQATIKTIDKMLKVLKGK